MCNHHTTLTTHIPVLFPPNLSLECEGGRLIVSWANNPKNAQVYPRTTVGNNVTVGNCSYPNGTVLKVNYIATC